MNANLCEKCRDFKLCVHMHKSSKIQQIFYCFTYYDNLDKRKYKSNYSCLHSARYYRNLMLNDKARYSKISDIFEDSLDI